MSEVKITLDDLRACGVCRRAKPWLRDRGLDINDMRARNGGMPVFKLYALNDQGELIKRLEEAAKKRMQRGGSDGR